MDPQELRAGLIQLMEHWGRSGISHLAKPSAGRMTAEDFDRLRGAGWLAAPKAPADVSRSGQSRGIDDAATVAAASGAVPAPTKFTTAAPTSPDASSGLVAASPSPVAAPSGKPTPAVPAPTVKPKFSPATPQTVPTAWELPSLPVADRSECMMRLSKEVAACTKCPALVRNRSRTVFGVGNLTPRVCFFGEAPGADEDRRGEPFVGAAGQLLDKIIAASQMRRQDVYILNSLKCRPPENRTPEESEIENCRPYFEQQLQWLQPEYIVCLGAVAVRSVLRTTESIGRLRGKFHAYQGAKVLVTYHPAYLLRNEGAKKLAWEDMKLLMRDMGIPIPGGK